MTQKELDKVIDLHKKWIDVEEGGERADLRGSDLSGSDLSGSNLRGSDLRGSDLRGSNLRGSDLRDSDLRGSDLRDSDLRGSDLRGSDLSGSDLRGSDLRDSYLSGVENSFSPEVSLQLEHDKTLYIRVAEAVLQPEALNMGRWHTCNTTHCLAGWAIHLSGAAGYALEKILGPSVAGSILCPELSHLFFEDNERALDACRKVVEANK